MEPTGFTRCYAGKEKYDAQNTKTRPNPSAETARSGSQGQTDKGHARRPCTQPRWRREFAQYDNTRRSRKDTPKLEALTKIHPQRRERALKAQVLCERASSIYRDFNTSSWPQHFQRCLLPPSSESSDHALVMRGKEIALRDVAMRDAPACLGCHGWLDRNPIYPEMAE